MGIVGRRMTSAEPKSENHVCPLTSLAGATCLAGYSHTICSCEHELDASVVEEGCATRHRRVETRLLEMRECQRQTTQICQASAMSCCPLSSPQVVPSQRRCMMSASLYERSSFAVLFPRPSGTSDTRPQASMSDPMLQSGHARV